MNPGFSNDNGYACAYCGTWVPSGTYHECPPGFHRPLAGDQPSSPTPQLIPIIPLNHAPWLERIAVALETIASFYVTSKKAQNEMEAETDRMIAETKDILPVEDNESHE